ncbi:uncharacterized protein [Branchiostoma lanceolatum]|uniref:uncharacterized protein n=1 Tax=Branchiostoma lanceolatum TaxID=7740 RepID=UPI003453E331
MKDILAKCLAGRENDWDRILPHVALAYNTSLHTTSKRSPFYLVHGREARLPVDVACQLPATTAHLADLTTAITSVRDAIAQSHQTQDQHQAPRVNHHQYRVGDRVWLHHPPSALYKLRLPWTGPFTVINTLPPVHAHRPFSTPGLCLTHMHDETIDIAIECLYPPRA